MSSAELNTVTDSRHAAGSAALGPSGSATPSRRVESVDLVRGALMLLMALGHTRLFFYDTGFSPTDLTQTSPGLFALRWLGHFAAPNFVFLAGTAAFFYGARRTRRQLAFFLVTRGLWLVLLEITVIRVGFSLNFPWRGLTLQVIWATGWSMVVLAGLVFLPRWAIAAFGLAMIGLHNMLDPLVPEDFGTLAFLWAVLHVPEQFKPADGVVVNVLYPLVPWIGVMAAGYAFGSLLQLEAERRRALLIRLGGALVLGFFALRALNLYGDPEPWSGQGTALYTVLSFLKVEKYPPSLLYLLLTIGAAIVALGLLDGRPGKFGRFLTTYGRAPLFFYVLHLFVLHSLAVAFLLVETGRLSRASVTSEQFGLGLAGLFPIWLAVVGSLYPLTRWFAGLKARRRDLWWLRYL